MAGNNGFASTLTLDDFTSVTTSLNASFKDVFKYEIPKKQVVAWGAGVITQGGADIREALKVVFKNSSNEDIDGKVRISISDANEANNEFVREFLMSDLRGDGKKLGVIPSLAIGEDAFLVVEARTISGSKTISLANSTVEAPITKQLINNLPNRRN